MEKSERGIATRTLAVVAVAIVVASLAVGAWHLTRKPAPRLFVGAYAEYEVSGAVPFMGDLTGILRMEIVDETPESYIVSYTATGPFGFGELTTEVIPKGKVLWHYGPEELELMLIGYETMPTILGTRNVVHYRGENYDPALGITWVLDLYVDKETDIVVLMRMKDTEGFTLKLSRTNIF